MGSPSTISQLTLNDLERSISRSLRYQRLVSRKVADLGHMLLLKMYRKTYKVRFQLIYSEAVSFIHVCRKSPISFQLQLSSRAPRSSGFVSLGFFCCSFCSFLFVFFVCFLFVCFFCLFLKKSRKYSPMKYSVFYFSHCITYFRLTANSHSALRFRVSASSVTGHI